MEINARESYLYVYLLLVTKNKKKNMNKIRRFSDIETTGAIPFKFGMWGGMYKGYKIGPVVLSYKMLKPVTWLIA